MDKQNDHIVPKTKNRAHCIMRSLILQGSAGSQLCFTAKTLKLHNKKEPDELVDVTDKEMGKRP
jgi:hypothetical protein